MGMHDIQEKNKSTCPPVVFKNEATERIQGDLFRTDIIPAPGKDSVRSLFRQG